LSTTIGIWVAAILTIFAWTYLYGDNPLWRIVEYLYVGLAVGYMVGTSILDYVWPTVARDIPHGHWEYVIPAVIGLLVYFRYGKTSAWLARYPIAVLVGYGAGYQLGFQPRTLLGQIAGSFYQLNKFDNWVITVLLLGGLLYFFFTLGKNNPVVKGGSWVGRYGIVLALGASFGSTLLYRYTLFYGRALFILRDWLHLVH
jgi:hypothetical protein